ncbi:MAG: hypothetical protein MZV63_55565 [Marinilabiliales bacterium]|nr:hypothetical protein [Marinilabiliales bacterium]
MKRGFKDEYLDRFNYENFGGTPILGVNGNAIIGHGISSSRAICKMILQAREITDANLPSISATPSRNILSIIPDL